jgi:hypothetical protein
VAKGVGGRAEKRAGGAMAWPCRGIRKRRIHSSAPEHDHRLRRLIPAQAAEAGSFVKATKYDAA